MSRISNSSSSTYGTYERLLTEILKPAFAIFSMVASCRLPFGRPNFNFLLIRLLQILFDARTRILFRRRFHTRDRLNLPSPARKRHFLLFRFHFPLEPSSFFASNQTPN